MSRKLPNSVILALSEELKPFGFKLVRKEQYFARRIEGREEQYHLTLLVDKPGYRIQPWLGVRFDQVEEIFHRTSGFEPRHQVGSFTVGIDLRNEYGKDKYELSLIDECDVPKVVARLVAIFHEVAEPYYSHFNSLQALDSALNDQPDKRCIHQSFTVHRCSRGLIVAKLTSRKNYNELVKIYMETVRKDAKGFYLREFEALVRDLEKMQPEIICAI